MSPLNNPIPDNDAVVSNGAADHSNIPLPAIQTAALTAAAEQITTLNRWLPQELVTRSDATTSHHIGQDYIVRLRHAGSRGGISAYSQLMIGAVIGAMVSGLNGIYQFCAKPMAELQRLDVLSMIVFVSCLVIAIVFHLCAKEHETVENICDEIEGRTKAPI